MTSKSNQLSNPFSTGGGGAHFEAHIQASFVALMLTGGCAPCLPCWPITEIKLQGKIDGFHTDDLIVTVENPDNKEQRKLLGQVKHSIAITKGNALFGEVMQAAWYDFKNAKVFTQGKDIIALITGPISATDQSSVQWLLDQARHTKDVDEFFRNVQKGKFSSRKKNEKLQAFQHHLKAVNGGNDVSKDKLYSLLNHFHLLGYDLGNEVGVDLSLLHSHISQFGQRDPQWVWSRVVDVVQSWNQDAGTITPDNLPEDLLEAFKRKAVTEMPEEFKADQEKPRTDWTQHPDATYLALAVLIGTWSDKSESDLEAVTKLLGIEYEDWLQKAQALLHHPDGPLSVKNGIWKVENRTELLSQLGSRLLDQNLDTFKSLAVKILKETDPAFELPAEQRYLASLHGKVLSHSHVLRQGIAEGLAILGSQPDACSNCSQGKAEATCVLAIREIFADADWPIWGSLDIELPSLAEAAPGEFLDAVERSLRLNPCPFDELFAQEGSGSTGGNYLVGLLWALEALAWDQEYFVRVIVALGELANNDPGGQSANRPSNSLRTILLPWLPQTLASVEKREVAIQTLLNEWPDIGWNLIIQLLPGQRQSSSGSYKPKWRKTIPNDSEKGVTQQEYWRQASFYAQLAVDAAGSDTARLSELIDHFNNLSKPAFDQLLEVLSSQAISELSEDKRLPLWNHLTTAINKHKRFADAKWALPDELITQIENVSKQLAPSNPFNLYQHLFNDRDFDLYEENADWREQQKNLNARRDQAIREIFQQEGVEGVIRFVEAVALPGRVGHSLGAMVDEVIEQTLLPRFLDSEDIAHKAVASGYIWRRQHNEGWEWCDNIEKSGWTPEQIGYFLVALPFTQETWDRASLWLGENEREYWSLTGINDYRADADLAIAIEKLVEYDRPHAAIYCLDIMRHSQQPINVDQGVRALLAALSSSESTALMSRYRAVELIKYLQSEPSVAQEDLFKVEWAYLPWLDREEGVAPKLLESRMTTDPEFFCELIRLTYRSEKEEQPPQEPSEESRALATNVWRLLREWGTPPGTQGDGTFDADLFNEWLHRVKTLCEESGHVEAALVNIGKVLIHAPSDPNGLWIHRAAAAVLNERDAEHMRDGFRTQLLNSRGVHWVDPTGAQERELADNYREQADEVENAGYSRLATTMRNLAETYEREAEQVASREAS